MALPHDLGLVSHGLQTKRLEPSHFSKLSYSKFLGGALIWLKGFDPNTGVPGEKTIYDPRLSRNLPFLAAVFPVVSFAPVA